MANILITGTSSGIGLATALEFGRAGHTVYATMRSPERAPLLGETAAKEKLPIVIQSMDVDSDASVAGTVESILLQAGRIDVLVNNAGVERSGAIEELPLDAFRACMETNYFGAIRCIRAVLPGMREARSGAIVNVSSIAGRIASAPQAPYTASKWALEAMSECLAHEGKAFGIRVAIVEPGIIDTPMARGIETPAASRYPHLARFGNLFTASLARPCPATVVATAIREIVESGTENLRHPVGPDAVPFLAWRAAMTDEEWVAWGALGDDDWYTRVERDFGLDARPKH